MIPPKASTGVPLSGACESFALAKRQPQNLWITCHAVAIPRFAGEQLSFDPPGYLFFGDNLEVMRRHLPDESVDLVYLDPPFNSNRSYNLLFEYRDGAKAAGQLK